MEKLFRSVNEAQAASVQEEWGRLVWLADQQRGNADGLTLGRVTIRKGHRNPRHSHPNCEEVLYLLKGRLRHWVGTESFDMEPGDTVSIPATVPHYAESNGDEDAEMIVAYSEGVREFRLEPED